DLVVRLDHVEPEERLAEEAEQTKKEACVPTEDAADDPSHPFGPGPHQRLLLGEVVLQQDEEPRCVPGPQLAQHQLSFRRGAPAAVPSKRSRTVVGDRPPCGSKSGRSAWRSSSASLRRPRAARSAVSTIVSGAPCASRC